jgi:hypothetical protein
MDETDGAAFNLAELHPIPFPVLPIELADTHDKKSDIHLSLSLNDVTVRKVHRLAAKERLSDSAIVVAAPRELFDSEELSKLRCLVGQFGFACRRRRT